MRITLEQNCLYSFWNKYAPAHNKCLFTVTLTIQLDPQLDNYFQLKELSHEIGSCHA
jgi:hypothetical protein